MLPPGVKFDDLPRIDVVLITHNHYDHMDLPFLARLARRCSPKVITPLGNDSILRAAESTLCGPKTRDWDQEIARVAGGRGATGARLSLVGARPV